MTTTFGPFQLGHHSHAGPRESNQDTVLSIALPEDRWLLAVADGMGGLEDGERASQTALGALYRGLADGKRIVEAVASANEAVNREAKGVTMGTTLVAAVIDGRRAEIVSVGDSRAYRSDSLGLIQITRDHTMAEEATRNGSVLPGEVEQDTGPWGNALARYLGSGPEVEPDRFGPMELQQDGWLLLSSDGLHGVISAEEMESLLASYTDAQKAAEALVGEALNRGTGDNVSVVLAYWPDAPISKEPPPPLSRAEPEPPPEPPETSTSAPPEAQHQEETQRTPAALPAGPPPPRSAPPRSKTGKSSHILIGPRRRSSSRKRLARAVKLLLIIIPLLLAVAFFVNRMLSSTP